MTQEFFSLKIWADHFFWMIQVFDFWHMNKETWVCRASGCKCFWIRRVYGDWSYCRISQSANKCYQKGCKYTLHDFNFHITNFPFLSSNIPSSPAYGVFISQLIRYARASSSYECFILRLSNKLLGQGYVKERLRSSLRKFYGRYGDLIKQYGVPISRMLHDILDDGHLQWHPPLIRHYTNFWPYYWSWPYYRIWLFTKLREVSIEHLQRVRHANRGRLLLRTPGPVPRWDLQVF